MKVKAVDLFPFFGLFSLSIIPLIMTMEMLKQYSYILFIAQLLMFYSMTYRLKNVMHFLTPIMLVIGYINVSFGIAGFTYPNGLVLETGDLMGFFDWQHYNLIVFYILTTSNILYIVDYSLKDRYVAIFEKEKIQISNKKLRDYSFIACTFFLLFSFIPLNVEFLGGSGNVAVIPQTLSVLVIIYIVAFVRLKSRYLIYIAALLFFTNFSYENKREAVFLMLAIALIEVIVNQTKPKIKHLFLMIPVVIFALFLILTMSIMRGYGGYIGVYDVVSIFDAISYIFDYISDENFWLYFFNNLEVNATFFHSINGIEYVLNDNSLLAYGSTIFKVLFIFIPSFVVDFKPDSIIHLYTTTHDPVYRSIGGSWPINIYSEFFWNFHLAGMFLIGVFFYFINVFFIKVFTFIRTGKALYYSWVIYAYMELITLARGSGFDMYMVSICFAIFFSTLFVIIHKLFAQNSK